MLLRQGDTALVPVWPRGTRVSDAGVTLPAANGGTLLRFNDLAYLFGSRAAATQAGNAVAGLAPAGSCGADAFIVNRADTQRRLLASSPHSPYTSGLLVRRGQCLVIENVEGTLLPIWPAGTQITDTHVTTPNLRGQAPLILGGRAGITGRYVHADDGSLQRLVGAQAECARRGMIVETANRVYLADTALEAAAESDAVLVAELVTADISDPLADNLLTTLRVRVVEVLRGSLHVGDMLNIRHLGGRAPSGEWRGPADDSIVEALRDSRVKAGDRLLLFVNRDLYRQQAEGHGGRPVPGYTSASVYPITNGRIVAIGGLTMPQTLSELRAQLRQP